MTDEEFSPDRMARMTKLDVVTHYPSQFNVSANSNEITIVGGTTNTLMEEGRVAPVVKLEYQFIMKMSPQSAKDLLNNLSMMLEQYEKSYGKLDTDLLRRYGANDEQE